MNHFSGEIMSDGKNGPILRSVNEELHLNDKNNKNEILNKYWNGKKNIYCLVAFSGGEPIYKWSKKTKKERENAFINQLTLYFNKLINEKNIVKKHFIEYIDVSWIDCGPFDIFPTGWDKTYALKHFPFYNYWFVGDRCGPNGNDKEIYDLLKPQNRAYETNSPKETGEITKSIINEIQDLF